MPKIEIWKCDHCGKEEETQGDMKFLALIQADNMTYNFNVSKDKALAIKLWCQKCITETSMGERYHTIQTEEEAKKELRPTFEDQLARLLRDHIADEVTDQLSNSQ